MAPSCRVQECVYVSVPGSRFCAMHEALSASPEVPHAAGQLQLQQLRDLAHVAGLALVLAVVGLAVAVLALVLAVWL